METYTSRVNHHSLAVANYNEKIFYHIDSLVKPGDTGKIKLHFSSFLKLQEANGMEREGWNMGVLENKTYVRQFDNYSCGLKVINHFWEFMNTGTFAYKQYAEFVDRANICEFILQNSVNLCSNCLICFENVEDGYKCNLCKKGIHIACTSLTVEAFMQKFGDKCPLCTKFLE